ncbi:aldo/keto reductase [Plantactinospora sp. S1510]|uniref:Aldo/keto reductase n=1 Tax=Plantactinospora alkalitolerans TaxID=2789879 RepID=A0ABS0GXN5_9ACTN|nr:aldo/keto reductase [Plantactinospora alkalitolerans]MBF9130859.1 aldo/keto reductase [Plantactinospora alkalitolerans]
MTDFPRRPLGATGLLVTPVCVGGGPLGSMPGLFGYDVSAERGTETAVAAFTGPFNFLDTAAGYSDGASERRIGAALARIGGVPDGFVLATKVDRNFETGDFSGAQVRRSAEGSLERLGLDRLPLVYLHDPEHISFEEGMAPGGPVEALLALQREGVIGQLGVAGGPVDLMARYLRTGVFTALITHNRWTLVEQSAGDLLDEAVSLGVGVVNGAPFGGGILVKGTAATSKYAYRTADEEVLRRIRAMEEACAAHDVPLAAAALQFSTRDPRITSTIVGVSRPERIAATARLATWDIPGELWETLAPLAAPKEFWHG